MSDADRIALLEVQHRDALDDKAAAEWELMHYRRYVERFEARFVTICRERDAALAALATFQHSEP